MLRWTPLLLPVLIACGSADQPQADRARELSEQLRPSSTAVDTAQQRADSQFNTCLFVYDNEEKLRECLVLRFQWPTPEAGRRIAVYKAEIRRVADSIMAEQRHADSIRYAEIARQRAAEAAQRRRQQAAESAAVANAPFLGSRLLKLYYTNTPNCATVGRMSSSDRVIFQSAEAAEGAGYRRTQEFGC